MKSYENIENYLARKLSGSELTEFENALKSDPELKDLVDNYPTIKNISKGILELELLEEVKKVSATAQRGSVKKLTTRRNFWPYIAAAVFLGLVASYFIFNNTSNIDKNELLAQYYERPQNEDLVKGSEELDGMTDLGKAKYYFDRGENEKTAEILNNSTEESVEHTLWLGHAYFNMDNYKKAQSLFQEIKDGCMVDLCLVFRGKKSQDEMPVECKKR